MRPNSGVSGDILVAGLYKLVGGTQEMMDQAVMDLGFAELVGKIRVVPKSLNSIAGWGLELDLPHEHVHRKLSDILALFAKAKISPQAKALSEKAFTILAQAEAQVHGVDVESVEFHEVGAMDSILDTALSSIFFSILNPELFICGPLPICDGTINCAHGLLSSPAPAVSILLEGVAIRGIESTGETVTPTALSLLKAFGAQFGKWPDMTLETQALVFGTRLLPKVPNGAQFAKGTLTVPLKRDNHES